MCLAGGNGGVTFVSSSAFAVTRERYLHPGSPGLTGGVLRGTGGSTAAMILTGLGLTTIQSISITDSNSGVGGAGGQFSGFDLDAIRLATTSVWRRDYGSGPFGAVGF